MLKTHKQVIEQLSKRAMDLLVHPYEVRYFIINGCNYYMCWLDETQIAFGSGEIEILISNNMSEPEINRLFSTYIDSGYSERIDYNFWKEINTMEKLKEEAPWFTMWEREK